MTSVRRIVVGVDGSEYSLRALRWAVVEAGRHGAELFALTTWTALPPPIVSPYVDVTKAVDRQDGTSAAEQALQTVVANAMAGNPPIVVEMVATEGHPAEHLAEQSRHADLVVVGARGRGGIAGWLLGSVSQELLRHSFCPLAVVRSPDKDEVAAAQETLGSDWTRVVVGVDGSDYSKSALRWAAGEAKSHNAELTLLPVGFRRQPLTHRTETSHGELTSTHNCRRRPSCKPQWKTSSVKIRDWPFGGRFAAVTRRGC
jgi:nucleotide-binding universal stress UspA family protein